jgi:hypothetical protein
MGRATMLARDSSFINNTAGGPASQDGDGIGHGGAAMVAQQASLTAVNCQWVANQAHEVGGALFAQTEYTAAVLRF